MFEKLAEDIYRVTMQKLAFWPFTSKENSEIEKVKIPIYVDNKFVDETTGKALPSFKSIKQLKGQGYSKIDDKVQLDAIYEFMQDNKIPLNSDEWPEDKWNEYEGKYNDFIKNTNPYDYLKGEEYYPPELVAEHLRRYEEPYYEGQKPFIEEEYDPNKHWWRSKDDPTKFSDQYLRLIEQYK